MGMIVNKRMIESSCIFLLFVTFCRLRLLKLIFTTAHSQQMTPLHSIHLFLSTFNVKSISNISQQIPTFLSSSSNLLKEIPEMGHSPDVHHMWPHVDSLWVIKFICYLLEENPCYITNLSALSFISLELCNKCVHNVYVIILFYLP